MCGNTLLSILLYYVILDLLWYSFPMRLVYLWSSKGRSRAFVEFAAYEPRKRVKRE